MQSPARTNRLSGAIRAGRAITLVPVLFLLFGSSIKLAGIKPVIDSFKALGFDPDIALSISLLEALCLAVYLGFFPKPPDVEGTRFMIMHKADRGVCEGAR